MSDDSDGQRQCRRGVTVDVDVELDAAMALADMAGVGPAGEQQQPPPVRRAPPPPGPANPTQDDEEELASTRLSLELGKVGIQASPCSSSSSAGGGGQHPHHQQAAYHQQQQQVAATATATATGYGPRPRHALTEAEKEAKRLRRVLANRESARQTILRRQAIRDELARKVADLSSQNENMKKEKDMVMQEYLSLKEANKQLKEQVATRTAKKAAAAVTAAMPAQQQQQAESMAAVASTASPPATPPRPGFLYTAAAPAPVVPVPYVWGSWPPGATAAGYEHRGSPPPLCLQPCAWYYPVVQADPRGSPSSAYAQPQPPQQAAAPAAFQDPRGAAAEPVGSGGSPAGGGATAEEDTDDDPCSLTLGLDVVDKRMSAPVSIFPAGPGGGGGGAHSDRDKAATAAEARKRRKELTKLKHMHAATARPGGEQW